MTSNKATPKHSLKTKKAYAIIGVAALVAILILAAWYLYHQSSSQQNNVTNTTNNKPIDDNSMPDQTPAPDGDVVKVGQIFRIPELGIQFELPEGLEGLEYEVVGRDSSKAISVAFTLQEYRKSSDLCNAKNAPLGALVRFSYNPLENPDMTGAFPQNTFTIEPYYFSYRSPQQPCSQDDDMAQKQIDLSVKLNSTLRSAKMY